MVLKVGYIFSGEVKSDVWEIAAEYESDGGRLVSVEMALEEFEMKVDNGDELTEPEQKLYDLCKAAEAQGLGDIVINPE